MRITVIGAGPAGLFAAIFAARQGAEVLLVEKLPQPGRKLLASGNGKCNIANTCTPEELAEAFGRNGRFTLPALYHFSGEKEQQWFTARGVPWKLTDGFHYFPTSEKASDILQMLLKEAQKYSVRILSGTPAEHLLIREGRITGVVCSGGKILKSDAVILASGGRGYPALGGGVSGYRMAEESGHAVRTPLPAMTGLCTKEHWPKECAGIALEDCVASIALPKEKMKKRGQLLFTQNGVSAFAVLDLAGRFSELLQSRETVPLQLDLLPEKSAETWKKEFDFLRAHEGSKTILRWLGTYFPRKLAANLVPGEDLTFARCSKGELQQLLGNLTALKLEIHAVEGWEKAMVTRGGVTLKEVYPETLESRLVPGLYFAGEVLDLDGPCGGYNLTWAVSSGALAGYSAGNRK